MSIDKVQTTILSAFEKYGDEHNESRMYRTEIFDMVRLGFLVQEGESGELVETAEIRRKSKGSDREFDPVYDHVVKLYKHLQHIDGTPFGVLKSEFIQKDKGGRLNAKANMSFATTARYVRHATASSIYYDIDIVNCHPVFLAQYCSKIEVPCEALEYYIENRDQLITEIMDTNPDVDRDSCKTMILALLNGGSSAYTKLKHKPRQLVNLRNEMKRIIKSVAEANKELAKQQEKKRKEEGRNFNHDGSVMCLILQRMENEALTIMEEVFIDHGVPIDSIVPIHDGMQVPKCYMTEEQLVKAMADAEKAIKYRMHCKVQIKAKPMGEHKLFILPEPTIDNIERYCKMNFADPNADIVKMPFDSEDNIYDMARYYETKVFGGFEEVIKSIGCDLSKCVRRVLYPPCFVINKGIQHKGTEFEEHPVDIEKEVNVLFRFTAGKPPVIQEKVHSFSRLGDKAKLALPLYKTITFEPNPMKHDPAIFNMFRGLRAKRRTVDMVKLRPILDHMRNAWFGGNDDLMDYTMHWFHQALAEPWNKTGIAIFLFGDQGTGKSFLSDQFFRPLVWGADVSLTVQGLNKIGGRFNCPLMNKLAVFVNELTSDLGFHETGEIFKSYITDATFTPEKKGIDMMGEYPLPCNFIFTTNNMNGIKLDRTDRRYFCVETSNIYRGNFKYFEELKKSMTQEVADMFYTYACDYQVTRNLRDIPITKLKEEMLTNALTGIELFHTQMKEEIEEFNRDPTARYSAPSGGAEQWVDRLNQSIEFKEDCAEVKASELYDIYKTWCEANREKIKANRIFAQDIKKWVGFKKTIKANIYMIPVSRVEAEPTSETLLEDEESSDF
jgi:hypothetical protein